MYSNVAASSETRTDVSGPDVALSTDEPTRSTEQACKDNHRLDDPKTSVPHALAS